jgi:hypothetical protein
MLKKYLTLPALSERRCYANVAKLKADPFCGPSGFEMLREYEDHGLSGCKEARLLLTREDYLSGIYPGIKPMTPKAG